MHLIEIRFRLILESRLNKRTSICVEYYLYIASMYDTILQATLSLYISESFTYSTSISPSITAELLLILQSCLSVNTRPGAL